MMEIANSILISTVRTEEVGMGWPWFLLNLKPLLRNVNFVISKVAPFLEVASSASE